SGEHVDEATSHHADDPVMFCEVPHSGAGVTSQAASNTTQTQRSELKLLLKWIKP
ncbi:hypothetical protein KUCAC02_035827, partial [Chaenocephalus aceratus]